MKAKLWYNNRKAAMIPAYVVELHYTFIFHENGDLTYGKREHQKASDF